MRALAALLLLLAAAAAAAGEATGLQAEAPAKDLCTEVHRMHFGMEVAEITEPNKMCATVYQGNADEFSDPAIFLATSHGHDAAVRAILAAGGDPDLRGKFRTVDRPILGDADSDGHTYLVTPLMAAARYGRADTVRLLLSKGAARGAVVQEQLADGSVVELEWTAADLAITHEAMATLQPRDEL